MRRDWIQAYLWSPSLEGVLPFAKSLDTLGFFTHTPADTFLLWEALGHPTGRNEEFAFAAPDPIPEVEPEMQTAFQNALSSLTKAGVSVRKVDIAPMLTKLVEANRTLMFYEGARFHQQRFSEFGQRLGQMAALVRDGLRIPAERYMESILVSRR